jgi:hypothetical protein
VSETEAVPTPAVAPAEDAVAQIAAKLFGKSDNARKDARKQLSEMVGVRAWEQLPAKLKTAARGDARRVLGDGIRNPERLTSAGYSETLALQLLRDIGRA